MSWDKPEATPADVSNAALQDPPIEDVVRKDANEVLVRDGPAALRQCIDLAEPLPIRGLFRSGPCMSCWA